MQRTTTLLLLQPGDRISLELHAFTVRGRDDPRGAADAPRDVVPVITRLPSGWTRTTASTRVDRTVAAAGLALPPASERV
ncbi:MAG TPA: hypothetical protein VFJ82_25455 [Longimicrobium sp.]|nr:hypothetical protein [Longimicrobium sp.]